MEDNYVRREIDKYPETNPFNDKKDGRIIGWWSGGVASAIACKIVLEKWGKERVSLVFCDTSIEHPETYRFKADFERVLGVKIKTIHSVRFNNPEEVWRKYKGMNFAHGAPCSMVMKKEPRIKYQDTKQDFAQVFGFDYNKKEMNRATNMLINNPDLNPIFPLIVEKLDRNAIFEEVNKMNIKIPSVYEHFLNNNCLGTEDGCVGGCIQGGVGYWQKIKKLYPKKFNYMAEIEHQISKDKGEPVTILKDQRKATHGNRIFLKKYHLFPNIESISVLKGREPVTPFECNGFCSTI